MELYRVSKKKYVNDLSGTGAKLAGNRWNSKGTAVVYISATLSLCTLECLAHFPPAYVPDDYAYVKLFCPDDRLLEIKADALPPHWKMQAGDVNTKRMGDNFVKEQKFLCMKAPSAIVSTEFNYVLNPNHPRFSEISILEINDFVFDNRLFTDSRERGV